LRDMVVSSQLQGVKVELRGDGLATDFRSFTLATPRVSRSTSPAF
jgi:hypothetical protein